MPASPPRTRSFQIFRALVEQQLLDLHQTVDHSRLPGRQIEVVTEHEPAATVRAVLERLRQPSSIGRRAQGGATSRRGGRTTTGGLISPAGGA